MAASWKKLNYTRFIFILFTFSQYSTEAFMDIFLEFFNNEPLTLFGDRKLAAISRRS